MKKVLFFLGFVSLIFFPFFAFSDEGQTAQNVASQVPMNASGPSLGEAMFQMLPLCIIIWLIFHFIVTKPQEKARKELEGSLQKGVEVLTTSGICGKIISIDNNFVHLEVAKGVGIKFSKQSIIKKL